MPIYEYVCEGCSHEFEELVLASEQPHCPACSSERLAKRFSSFAVGDAAAGGWSEPSAGFGGPAPGSCGTCGDPRGPGACSI